jgi:hypothetical protein
MNILEEIILVFPMKINTSTESLNKRVTKPEILVLYLWNGCQMLGPLNEFSNVFRYLIANKYRFEHLKYASV